MKEYHLFSTPFFSEEERAKFRKDIGRVLGERLSKGDNFDEALLYTLPYFFSQVSSLMIKDNDNLVSKESQVLHKLFYDFLKDKEARETASRL